MSRRGLAVGLSGLLPLIERLDRLATYLCSICNCRADSNNSRGCWECGYQCERSRRRYVN
jgi:hypothetical protein